MHQNMNHQTEYQFSDLKLNPQLGKVWSETGKNAEIRDEISLPVLSFKLLQVLVEAGQSIISQEKIIELVWQEQVVGNETLKQRIKLLRKSLGDNAQNPKYIGVVRGRGYFLIPPVKMFIQTVKTNKPYEIIYNSLAPNLTNADSLLLWKKMSIGLSLVIFILMFTLYFSKPDYSAIKNIQPLQTIKVNQVLTVKPPKMTQAFAYFKKGQSYYLRYKAEDNKIAIQLYQHALDFDPNLAIAYAGLADAYSQGVFQFKADDSWRALALNAAINAVRLSPKSEVAYKALGLAEYLNGQLNEAIISNLKAVDLKPGYLQATTNLGFIYREMGDLEQALKWNFKTIQTDPFYAPGYLHLAQSYQAQGKNKLAERNYIKALELKPDYQLAKDAYTHFLKINYL